MTAVFRNSDPTSILQGVNVGPADLVAVAAALHAVYGWSGGLNTLKTMLPFIKKHCEPTDLLKEFSPDAEFSEVHAAIFTSHGQEHIRYTDPGRPFGQDPYTEYIGLTIGALAHELGGDAATSLFMEYILPSMFRKVGEMREQIHAQLVDHQQQIVNEFATRGCSEACDKALSQAGIPVGEIDRVDEVGGSEDLSLVAGLLKWIAKRCKGTYFTRSSRVIRIAAYLKAVGYHLTVLGFWKENEAAPRRDRDRCLILVLSGHSDTDAEAEDPEGVPFEIIHHYRLETVGSMITSAFNDNGTLSPHTYQGWFNQIHAQLKRNLTFTWVANRTGTQNSVSPQAMWKSRADTPDPTSVLLATIRFRKSADLLAPYYLGIADRDLKQIQETELDSDFCAELPESVYNHRALTACIVVSVISRLAGDDFAKSRHACKMFLGDPVWLAHMAGLVDELLSRPGRLELWKAVGMVAVIHAAASFETIDPQSDIDYSRLIGWRYSRYSVLPRLLTVWRPEETALGIYCFDTFWANAVVGRDGSVLDAEPQRMTMDDAVAKAYVSDPGAIVPYNTFVGPASISFAEDEIYLNIERISRLSGPALGFCGRVDGRSVGFVSITQVLRVLAHSLEIHKYCPGHTQSATAYNVKTREWCLHRLNKPGSPGVVSLVSAKDDLLWTLFLAGHSGFELEGRICFGCFDCASAGLGKMSYVVGYKVE